MVNISLCSVYYIQSHYSLYSVDPWRLLHARRCMNLISNNINAQHSVYLPYCVCHFHIALLFVIILNRNGKTLPPVRSSCTFSAYHTQILSHPLFHPPPPPPPLARCRRRCSFHCNKIWCLLFVFRIYKVHVYGDFYFIACSCLCL